MDRCLRLIYPRDTSHTSPQPSPPTPKIVLEQRGLDLGQLKGNQTKQIELRIPHTPHTHTHTQSQEVVRDRARCSQMQNGRKTNGYKHVCWTDWCSEETAVGVCDDPQTGGSHSLSGPCIRYSQTQTHKCKDTQKYKHTNTQNTA